MSNRIFSTSIIDGAGFTTCGCILEDRTVIIGCDVAGLARSLDFGLTWTMQNGALTTNTLHVVADVAASKAVAGGAFAALGRQGAGGGFARTDDSGENWTILSTVPQFSGSNNVAPLPVPHPRSIGQLIVVDDLEGYIYALTFDDGVMRSTDGGTSWTTIGLAGHNLRGGMLDPNDPTKLYVLSWGDSTAGLANPGLYSCANARTGSPATFVRNTTSGFPTTPESLYVSSLGPIYVAQGVNGVAKFASGAWTTVINDGATWYVIAGYASGSDDVMLFGAYDAVKTGTQFAVLKKSVNSGTSLTDLTLDASKIHNTLGDAAGEEWWLPADTPGAKLGQNTSTVSGIVWNPADRDEFILTGRAGCYRTVNGADFYPSMRGLNLTINRDLAVDSTRADRCIVCNTDYVALGLDGTTVDQVKPSPNTGFFADVDPVDGYYLLGDGDRSVNTLGKVWESADPLAGPWVNLGAEGAGGGLSDTFDRSVAGGWGTADSGSAWTGSDAAYDVSPADGGTVALSGMGTSDISQTTLALADPTGVFTVDWSVGATGSFHAALMLLRRATNTHYDIRLRQLSTNGRVYVSIMKTVAGVQTLLGTEYQVATSYVPGDIYNTRFEISGTSPTTLKARAWREGQTEPDIWHVEVTDSEATLQTTGQVVARTQGATGYSANATFHWRGISISDLTSTAGSGGARPFGGKRIRDGSDNVVRVVAFEGFGIRYKVGAAAWTDGDTSLISSSATKTVPFAWAPTAKILFMYHRDVGVYRSVDYGVTWTLIYAHPSSGDGFGYIATEPTGERLLVSASDGLFWLTDADSGTVGTGITVTENLAATNPGTCCYGNDGAFYYCEVGASAAVMQWDSGTSWTDVSDEAYRQVATLPFAIDVDAEGKVYVALNGNGVVVGTLAATYAEGYVGGYGPTEIVEPPPTPTPTLVAPRTPDLRVLIDFANDINPVTYNAIAAEPAWADVSTRLRGGTGLSIRRGRERPLDRNEAGTATFVFDNLDRGFDPESSNSFGVQTAMRHIRAEAVTPHVTLPFKIGQSLVGGPALVGGGISAFFDAIYDGYIESWDFDYPGLGNDAIATAKCMDLLGVMAKDIRSVPFALDYFNPEPALDYTLNLVPYAGRPPNAYGTNLAGDRDYPSDTFLTSAGNSKYVIAVGLFTSQPLRSPVDAIAAADGGNFFINRKGQCAFRDHDWPLQPSGPIRIAVDAEKFGDMERAMDETLVYNYVALVNFNATQYATRQDLASQARYLKRDWPTQDIGLVNVGDLEDRAENILLRYREPQIFLSKLDLSNLVTDWRKILRADLWDIITVDVTLPNGDVISQRSMIEGIEISTPSRNIWNIMWWLSLPVFPNLLSEDAAGFEGPDALGTIGGWTAEANCTLIAQDQQVEKIRHGGGRRDAPITYTFELRPVYAAEGAWVLQADATGNGDVSFLSPMLPVEGRQVYVGDVKIRMANYGLVAGEPSETNPATDLDSSGRVSRLAHLEADWYDATSTYLSTIVGPTPSGHPSHSLPGVKGVPITDWWEMTVDGRAPDAAAFAQLRVKTIGTGKTGAYIDDGSFKRGG